MANNLLLRKWLSERRDVVDFVTKEGQTKSKTNMRTSGLVRRLRRWSSERRDVVESGQEDCSSMQSSKDKATKSEPHRLLSLVELDSSKKPRCAKPGCIAEIIYKSSGGDLTASSRPSDGFDGWTQLPSFPYSNMHILGFSNGMLLMVRSIKPPLWNMVTFDSDWMHLVVWDVKQGTRLKKISIPKNVPLMQDIVEDVMKDGKIQSLMIENHQLSVLKFAVVGKKVQLDMALRPKNMVQDSWLLGKCKFAHPESGIYLHVMSNGVAHMHPSLRLGKWVSYGGFLYMLAYSPSSDSLQLYGCMENEPGYAQSMWGLVLDSKELESYDGHGKLQSFTILSQNRSLLLLYRTSRSLFRIVELEVRVHLQGTGSSTVSLGRVLAEAPAHLMSWISCFEEERPLEWFSAEVDGTARIHITLASLKQQLVCDLSQTPATWWLIPRCTESLVSDLDQNSAATSRYFAMPLP